MFLAGRYFVDADPGESLSQLMAEAMAQYGLSDKVVHAAIYGAASVVRSFHTCLPGFSAYEEGTTLTPAALANGTLDWRHLSLDCKELAPLFMEGLGCFAEALQLCIAEGLRDDLHLETVLNKVRIHMFYSG